MIPRKTRLGKNVSSINIFLKKGIRDYTGGRLAPQSRRGGYKLHNEPIKDASAIWNTIISQDVKAKETATDKLGVTFSQSGPDTSLDTGTVNKVGRKRICSTKVTNSI